MLVMVSMVLSLVHALGLHIGEHAVDALVQTLVCTILGREGLVGADGFDYVNAAVRPGIALAAAHTIGAYLLFAMSSL